MIQEREQMNNDEAVINDDVNQSERGDRRKGGAWDTLARILRGTVQIGWNNGFMIKNRPGRKIDEAQRRSTGLVKVKNMFEMFYQNETTDGINGIMIGRQGDGRYRNTNLIEFSANYDPEIGSKEGNTNGWVKLRTTRKDYDLSSDNSGISVFDVGSTIVEFEGVGVRVIGQGANGGVSIAWIDKRSDTMNARIFINANGIQFLNIPTSNPGGSGRIWRDGNGFVRIT